MQEAGARFAAFAGTAVAVVAFGVVGAMQVGPGQLVEFGVQLRMHPREVHFAIEPARDATLVGHDDEAAIGANEAVQRFAHPGQDLQLGRGAHEADLGVQRAITIEENRARHLLFAAACCSASTSKPSLGSSLR